MTALSDQIEDLGPLGEDNHFLVGVFRENGFYSVDGNVDLTRGEPVLEFLGDWFVIETWKPTQAMVLGNPTVLGNPLGDRGTTFGAVEFTCLSAVKHRDVVFAHSAVTACSCENIPVSWRANPTGFAGRHPVDFLAVFDHLA